jgi:hypothetical protein
MARERITLHGSKDVEEETGSNIRLYLQSASNHRGILELKSVAYSSVDGTKQ